MNLIESVDFLSEKFKNVKSPIIVAVDGRCGSGKTTLAAELSRRVDCNVIHADSFFLQGFQRTEERLAEIGGNIDYERLKSEVLEPLSKNQNKPFSYGIFDCKSMSVAKNVMVEPKPVTIIEGSYSCHPTLWDYYGFRVFVTVDSDLQQSRIASRNGKERLKDFQERWIPMEERYFEEFDIEKRCDLVVEN